MAKREDLSLYDEVKARGFEASIVATYNVDFAFYERVLLRRLQSVGCRHNIVLADASQCGKELATESRSPYFAGTDYALLPVKAGGAFHPKFILLIGRKKARLIIGSHNISVPGFGLSREVTSAVDIDPESSTLAAGQAVWDFIRAWTAELPTDIQKVIAATDRIAPWLTTGGAGSADHPLLMSLPGGTSLWDQLRPRLKSKVTRVFVVSPYFDVACSFLKTLQKELNPKELIVGLQPKHVLISEKARTLIPRARFVNVSGIGDTWGEKRLHAKLIRFEFQNGESLVVTGSANASAPAWTSDKNARNAEIVVVHENGNQVWRDLGLDKIAKLKVLSDDDWKSVGSRELVEVDEDSSQSGQAPTLAVATSDGFVVSTEFAKGLVLADIDLVGGIDMIAKAESLRTVAGGVLVVCSDPKVLGTATLVRGRTKRGPARVAVIHRVGVLLDRAAGTTHQAFRRALSGLEGDPEQLSQLIQIVEKAIFDTPVSVQDFNEASARTAGRSKAKPDAAEYSDLMVSAKDTVKGRRQRRVSSATDLALIIDRLIYKLGQGLHHDDTDSPASTKAVEPRADDEDDDRDEPDGHELAKLCRGKVNRLFRRMIQQMEAAIGRDSGFTQPIVQLAAVLGVVKHLRRCKVDWLPRGEELVDFEHAWEFFKDASRVLYAPELNLALKALTESRGHEFDELTICRALLAWLAIDCELDARTALDEIRDEPEEARENLVGIAYFLPVITACTHDEQAEVVLRDAFVDERVNSAIAQYHLQWAGRIEERSAGVRAPAERLAMGDIVIPTKMAAAFPSVVVDVEYDKVRVLDLMSGDGKPFKLGYLAKVW